jgi:hypothetical protein
VKAVGSYDNNDFDEALNCFAEIADTSKILFNCGVIHATLGEHEKAVRITFATPTSVRDAHNILRSNAMAMRSKPITTSPLPISSKAFPTF